MTLKSDIEEWFGGTTKWPGDLAEELENVTLVYDEIVDTGRWSTIHEAVFVRKQVHTVNPELSYLTEHVGVTYREPATEMQDWGDEGSPHIYTVEPYEEVVVKFKRTES